jgi:hypothetical protein
MSNGVFVAAHGGNNGESHNHNDVGDFIVYVDDDPVIIDVGSGTYTAKTFSKDRYTIWFNASAWHNLPAIDGEQQSAGANYAASDVSYKNQKGKVSLSMNIDRAYPASAHVRQWKRVVEAAKGSVAVDDEYELTQPAKSITQTFMTVCDVDIRDGRTVILTTAQGKKISLQHDIGWTVEKEMVPLVSEEDQGLKNTWRNRPITRILMTRKNPQLKGRFHFNLSRVEKD